MRTIATVCVVLLMSCASSGSKPPVDWPAVVSCTDIGHSNLLGTVQDVLLNPDVEPTAELERLAQEHGAEMIACVVDQAVDQFAALLAARPMSAESGAPPPPSDEKTKAAAAATRGRDFLQRVGTTVEGGGQ